MIYLAFSFCDLELWQVGLSWLLPFLLGLLLGWAIWAKYKKIKEQLEDDIRGLKKKIKGLEEDLVNCRHHGTELDSEVSLLKGQLREKNLKISTLEASLEAANKKASVKAASASVVAGAVTGLAASGKSDKKKDDLKKIEGIGPKVEKLLNEDKIRTYNDLADSKKSKLRKILDAGGPKYQIIKPDTWPEQAALARDGKWGELEDLQKILVGGIRPTGAGIIAGAAAAKDDLKKVEGIGPKIEGLLNSDGINTFAELAGSEMSRLQRILDDAGPRYRISKPDTWAEQAALARDGKWDELAILQGQLKGGRKV
ncbi:helix-hairpin-helix domain-containing protein [Portibacter lacus]|uniref:50S ribosomal protein L21 n=1 Tax=Portibacter lacus TaxID=1099794 RepID=A0AA37SVA8_9BACT|nr:helix-hairpin-helix domain-containing protein [Portibacter lacus]GLR19416.1 hypothetical protein GCM10007940_40320 [Portibacter lacus]